MMIFENERTDFYQKRIKAFLVLNPSSTAEQICNGIRGNQERCISELKTLIQNGEVEYSLMITLIVCVRKKKDKR